MSASDRLRQASADKRLNLRTAARLATSLASAHRMTDAATDTETPVCYSSMLLAIPKFPVYQKVGLSSASNQTFI